MVSAFRSSLISAGISSHAPLPFDTPWSMRKDNLGSYLEEIKAAQKVSGATEIYKGLEIDFIPGKISPNDYKDQLDYTIGSIHFAGFFPDGKGWEIDGSHLLFLKGLEQIFDYNHQAAIKRYFELTRDMIRTSGPDIIGHMDKIKIQNTGEKFFSESDRWYMDEIEATLESLKKYGGILEINTRGIYQKKSDTPYPSPWIIERAFRNNIPVTLSSDAHHIDDLTNRFSETAQLLLHIGFREIHILNKGLWQPVPFDEHGIIS